MYLNDAETAGPASEEALVLARACGDSGSLAADLGARQLACEGPDGVEERECLAEQVLTLARDGRNPGLQMQGRLWRVDASFERRLPRPARRRGRRSRAGRPGLRGEPS
jgi:hypothetical protein